VTLIVIHCNVLTVIVLKMYEEAALLSALMKMYTFHCHDRGHINVMFVLQSCTDCLHILPHSSRETFPTSSDSACNFINIEVEDDVDLKEEGFISIKEEVDIKSESDEVSYVLHVCC